MADTPEWLATRCKERGTWDKFRRLADTLDDKASAVEGLHGPDARIARITRHATDTFIQEGNLQKVRGLALLKRTPVTIDEFVTSKEFLGELQDVWPRLMPDIRRVNPDVFTGAAPVHEALLGGATGTGKTTISYTTLAYQDYLFSCFNHPQLLFGLSPVTPIVFMMQSVSQSITKRVVYRPLRALITAMPFTRKWRKWDDRTEAELRFEDGTMFVPALANVEALLGQAIAGAMLDEANFMRVIENSKQVAGARGKGGYFDQAKEVYTNLTRRRQRSFQTRGYSLGCVITLSSTRYKNDFLDQRIDEVRKHSLPNIVTMRRKQYEVVPQDRFSGGRFSLLVGTDRYPTRVLTEADVPGQTYPERGRVLQVPVEYRAKFLTDPEGSLRDIVGIATDSIEAFITQRHKLVDSVERWRARGEPVLCAGYEYELATEGMSQWDDAALKALTEEQKKAARWVHVDLSLSKDPAGIAVLRYDGHVTRRDPDTGIMESLPTAVVEALIQLRPSPQRRVDIAEVRRFVTQLITFYGLNIREVTFDGFQSAESIQSLIRAGVRSRLVSLDRDPEPYVELRRAFYEDRIDMCDSEVARIELANLEFLSDKNRIDHPPKGSKDVSDALAGAFHAMRTSRKIRTRTRILDGAGAPYKTDHSRGDPERRDMRPRPAQEEKKPDDKPARRDPVRRDPIRR
jgi:hypothetical protein